METYKQFWLRAIKGLYKPYTDIEKWNDQSAYFEFKAKYEILVEAYESIKNEPHMWVKNALNEYYQSWTGAMAALVLKGAK